MGKRVLSGKISLLLFGMLNLLMVSGPVILPACRSFVKMKYARIWRTRIHSRRQQELLTIRISHQEYERYREGEDEIWLGNHLYDIEEIKPDKAGVCLRVEYDQEETNQLAKLSKQQQKNTSGELSDISTRWLQWLSELVPGNHTSPVPAVISSRLVLHRGNFTSAIRNRNKAVDQQPPDDLLISCSYIN